MRLGILSDIHADADALERALSCLFQHNVDKIVCAGDLVEKGPHGDRVIARLQDLMIPSVRGNHDENAIIHASNQDDSKETTTPEEAFSESYPHEELSIESIEYLQTLPPFRRYLWEGKSLALVHDGSAFTGEALSRYHSPKRFKRMMRAADADIVLIGHTHIPSYGHFDGIQLYNPGSVCHRKSRDSHTCAILTLPSGSFEVFALCSGEQITPTPLW